MSLNVSIKNRTSENFLNSVKLFMISKSLITNNITTIKASHSTTAMIKNSNESITTKTNYLIKKQGYNWKILTKMILNLIEKYFGSSLNNSWNPPNSSSDEATVETILKKIDQI